MTGQTKDDSDVGLSVALGLANLARTGGGRSELRAVFAADAIAVDSISDDDAELLLELATRSAEIVGLLASDDVDEAAHLVNDLLELFPSQLHLTKRDGCWLLHRHRPDAPFVSAWNAVVAAAFARIIGDGVESRIGTCPAADCGNHFFDLSKNQSRRFCSLACQNRVKAAAYRARKAG